MPTPTPDTIDSSEYPKHQYVQLTPAGVAKSSRAFVASFKKALVGSYPQVYYYSRDAWADPFAERSHLDEFHLGPDGAIRSCAGEAYLRADPVVATYAANACIYGASYAQQTIPWWPDSVDDSVLSDSSQEREALVNLIGTWHSRYLAAASKRSEFASEDRYVDYRAMGELFAITDIDESTWALEILARESAEISVIVDDLGVERTVFLANLLGRADAATVHEGRLFATGLGKALGKAVSSLADGGD